jgi:hypothetical protein
MFSLEVGVGDFCAVNLNKRASSSWRCHSVAGMGAKDAKKGEDNTYD